MRKKAIIVVTFLLAVLTLSSFSGTIAYANDIQPVLDASTVAKWEVLHAPDSVVNMYFTAGGKCLVEDGSTVSFSVGNIDEDVEGLLRVGNVSILTNDTDVSRDLVLGIGIFTSFEPGLFVKVGASNLDALNESAFATAARVDNNPMNGTITSVYENVTIGENEYEAITFDYEQDSQIVGDPQKTRLIYDINSGILLYANTSYWFGEGSEPYWLQMEFIEIAHVGFLPPIALSTIVIASTIIILLVVAIVRKRM
jgi:hypothetical protein